MFGCFERVHQKNHKVEVEEKIYFKKKPENLKAINIMNEKEYQTELQEESKTIEIQNDISMFKIISKDERRNVKEWIT